MQFGELQAWDVVSYFGLGFLDGTAVKYLLRWRHKGGISDLEKAQHYIEKLLEQQRGVEALKAKIEASAAFKRGMKKLADKRKKRGNNRHGKGISPKVRPPRGAGNRNSASRFEGPTVPPSSRRGR